MVNPNLSQLIKSGAGKIAVVGLGYVGLPLATAFGRQFEIIGFDINAEKVAELQQGYDRTDSISATELAAVKIQFTTDPTKLRTAAFIIVAVPTPITEHRKPDLTPLKAVSQTIGKHMPPGAIVVYESTVYPGVTEELCVPILEQFSGLRCGVDFKVGYSPERVNPGDAEHTIEKIVKVVSGQDQETLDTVAAVYETVITAGVYKAPNIKTAEAAKVIENTQRDLNIALMNELALIFDRMQLDTKEVLAAASTKWNFLKFYPGLVGGHCIGVDPYYLTYKAESLNYNSQVILSGRRINDGMGKFIAEKTIKLLIKSQRVVYQSRILILGLTFKENVRDIRNTKVLDIINELSEYGICVLVADPLASPKEVKEAYGFELVDLAEITPVDGIIFAVQHSEYNAFTIQDLHALTNGQQPVLVDVPGRFDNQSGPAGGFCYWRL